MYAWQRGQGPRIRRFIAGNMFRKAKEMGYHTCYLETTAGMAQAQKLYLRHGFNKLPVKKGETGHFGCDAFLRKKFNTILGCLMKNLQEIYTN